MLRVNCESLSPLFAVIAGNAKAIQFTLVSTEPLTITKSQQGDVEVLTLAGSLTLANLFEFQDAIRGAITSKTILEMSRVSDMDSAGLGTILSFHSSCGRHEHKYAIAGASQRITKLLEVAKLMDFLNLYPTVEEAKTSLK